MLYFLKYYNVKLHINTKYFGETLEGPGQVKTTGQVAPKKASQQYGVFKKPVNEFVKTHLLAISLGLCPRLFFILELSFDF